MRFTFTEKKVKVTDDLRQYAEKKVGKLDRYFKTESDAYITFSMERGKHIAEVTLKNNGMFYRVTESTRDMFASIDSAVAGIERQIRRNKTRLEKRLREGAFEREIKPVISETVIDDDEPEFEIVRTKKFSLKPMSPEEAILQMNLLNHEFYVFKKEEDDSPAIVYKRKSGGYGLIDTAE